METFETYAVLSLFVLLPIAFVFRKRSQKKYKNLMNEYFRANNIPENTYFFQIFEGLKPHGFVAFAEQSLHVVPYKAQSFQCPYNQITSCKIETSLVKLPSYNFSLTNGTNFVLTPSDSMANIDGFGVKTLAGVALYGAEGIEGGEDVISNSTNKFISMLQAHGVNVLDVPALETTSQEVAVPPQVNNPIQNPNTQAPATPTLVNPNQNPQQVQQDQQNIPK